MSDGPDWFAPKRYGFGAGRPISWQGWTITIAFVLLVALAVRLIRYSAAGSISLVVMLTLTFLVICARTTRGGWRWRWGDKD